MRIAMPLLLRITVCYLGLVDGTVLAAPLPTD
ncbi:hypothetical protein GmarT_06980 [Gimesia maris]|uniref:Uncharacterized protein n=1 Tax=Gimesia maris TaxID=122 RepID=A0ABX5YGP2_9PLAN|nr:hypothetical protein CA11_07170 [Gimesia maris]QEG14861.1 hypothetical protein GmarT_06980 [Gimesia maris]